MKVKQAEVMEGKVDLVNTESSQWPPNKSLAVLAAANGFIAVALGAFGAHGLKRLVSSEVESMWDTGVHYHLFHALAIFAAVLISDFYGSSSSTKRWATAAGWCFVAGIVFFCGSFYIMVLAPQSWVMLAAPVGGIFFLAGWLALTWSLIVSG